MRLPSCRLCLCLLCIALLTSCVNRAKVANTSTRAGSSIAFVGVTVVPLVGTDVQLSNQTVVVDGDRIAAIGPVSATRIPTGARRIDATGKYLIPGLADMHVHLEHTEDPAILAMFLANGVTTVRSMDGRPYILEWKRRVATGDLIGPTIHTAGPVLDGDPPLRPDNTIVRTPTDARASVVAQQAAGYDFIKVYTNLSAEAYRAVLATARERGLLVAGHVPRTVSLDEALNRGQASIEHLGDYDDVVEAEDSPFKGRFFWFKRFLGMPADPSRMTAIAQRQAVSSTWTVPTLIQADREVARPGSVRAWMEAPEMSYIPAEGRSFWQEQAQRRTAGMDEEDWTFVARGRTNRLALVRAFYEAGAHILAGSDTPNPFVIPGFSLPDELVNLTNAGLTPGAAIATSTRDAAKFLGQLDEWGTVERGKRADLVLLDANPLDNIGNVRAVAGVMIRGRWLSQGELKTMLKPLTLAPSQCAGERPCAPDRDRKRAATRSSPSQYH